MCNRYLALYLKSTLLTLAWQNTLATWLSLGTWYQTDHRESIYG